MAQRQESYLTPVQRITEQSLAPRRLLDESMRVERELRNPLVETGSQLAVSGAPETVPAPRSNPLIRPPVPLSVMGTDQQIAWQQLEDEREADQMAREQALLKAEADRRTMELQREETTQSTAMLSELPKLQQALLKGDDDEYLAVKADLVSRYPVGAGSLEATRALKAFDDRYGRKASINAQIEKDKTARQEATRKTREDAAVKEAAQYGGDVVRDVTTRIAADPVKGIDDAYKILAQVQEKSVVQSLKDAGLNEEQIAQRYGTGKEFNYQAAKQAPKSTAILLKEKAQARQEWAARDKARTESGYDPNRPDRPSSWRPEDEQAYQDSLQYMNSLTPQVGGNRAGVAGMATKYVPYERTLNPEARVLAPAGAAPLATTPPVKREKVYRHPQTGERIALRNGKWEKI